MSWSPLQYLFFKVKVLRLIIRVRVVRRLSLALLVNFSALDTANATSVLISSPLAKCFLVPKNLTRSPHPPQEENHVAFMDWAST